MPSTLTFDARGRVTIPRHLREALGDRVVAIRTPHGVVLHPVPEHVDLPEAAETVSGDEEAEREA